MQKRCAIFLTLILIFGCASQTSNNNNISNTAKKTEPKDRLLGHWASVKPGFEYYFSPERIIVIGEVIEGEGETRIESNYKVLRSDASDNSIKIIWDSGNTILYKFLEDNQIHVTTYKGNEVTSEYKLKYIDGKQQP